ATQYSCMLLSYMLEHKMGKEKVVTKLKQLESSMSSGRKLFRLGNMVHAFLATKRASHLPDLVPRFCLTFSNLNRTLYFICDTVLWVRSVGLCSDINKKKWRHRATRCYYYSLVLNLVEDLFELCWRMEQTVRTEKAQEDLPPSSQRVQNLLSLLTGGLQPFLLLLCLTLRKHPPLLLDTVKNLCDLSSPLDRLGIYKTNPGVIGLCGLISSIVGILTVASPRLRLKP
ncbi:hypothetical protein lerEdw1_010954, partial [Lerista edwardsae]